MNLRRFLAAVSCGAVWLSMIGSASASDGWSGTSSKPAANGVTTSSTKKSWWPPWTSSKSKAKPKSSKSMWTSMTTGTKNTWNKTTSFLNPFDNPPKSAPSTQQNAANSIGWFGWGKTEPKQPQSIDEYWKQERPKW